VDFAHFIGFSGIVEDAFGDGGFPGIDMSTNSDVSDFIYVAIHFSITFTHAKLSKQVWDKLVTIPAGHSMLCPAAKSIDFFSSPDTNYFIATGTNSTVIFYTGKTFFIEARLAIKRNWAGCTKPPAQDVYRNYFIYQAK
jgi:hypothetical protein